MRFTRSFLLALVACSAYFAAVVQAQTARPVTATATATSTPPGSLVEGARFGHPIGLHKKNKYGHNKNDYKNMCIGGNLDTYGVWTSPCDGKRDKCCPGFQCKDDHPIYITVGDYSKYKSHGIVTSNEDAPYTDDSLWKNGNYGHCCVGENNYNIIPLICEDGKATDGDTRCKKNKLLIKNIEDQGVLDELACMCCGGKVAIKILNPSSLAAQQLGSTGDDKVEVVCNSEQIGNGFAAFTMKMEGQCTKL